MHFTRFSSHIAPENFIFPRDKQFFPKGLVIFLLHEVKVKRFSLVRIFFSLVIQPTFFSFFRPGISTVKTNFASNDRIIRLSLVRKSQENFTGYLLPERETIRRRVCIPNGTRLHFRCERYYLRCSRKIKIKICRRTRGVESFRG